MIQFRCPRCDRSIETSEQKHRESVDCPHCLQAVPIPRRNPRPPSPAALQANGLVPWLSVGITATCLPWSPDNDDDCC